MNIMLCPRHCKSLMPTVTRFGKRWHCPVGGCTVVGWDGSTTTPADYNTRKKRLQAHAAFDRLWKSGTFTRSEAYTELAAYMGLSKEGVRIGYFDIEQCDKVISFAYNTMEAI